MSEIMKKIKARAAQGGNKYTWEDLKRLREEDEAKQAAVFEQQFKEHAYSSSPRQIPNCWDSPVISFWIC